MNPRSLKVTPVWSAVKLLNRCDYSPTSGVDQGKFCGLPMIYGSRCASHALVQEKHGGYAFAHEAPLAPNLDPNLDLFGPSVVINPGEFGLCRACGNRTKLFCSKCRSVYYCSRGCQIEHLPKHKTRCQRIRIETSPKVS
jgi:hypothetical protein